MAPPQLFPFRYLFVFLVVICGSSIARAQGTFESAGNGLWDNTATWTLTSGSDGDGIPDANDNVTIMSGHTVTPGSANKNCANLVVNAGGTLHIDNQRDVYINANPGSAAISGTVTMSNTGRLLETGTGTRSLSLSSGGTLTISGAATNPVFDTFSFHAGSTLQYSGSANQTIIQGFPLGHLVLSGGGKKTYGSTIGDTTFTANGTVTVASGVTFDVSTNVLHANFNGDVVNNGILDAGVGTVVVNVRGSQWINNGTYKVSVTAGFGQQPVTTFTNTTLSGTTTTQRFYDLRFEGTCATSINIDSARHVNIIAGTTFNGGAGQTHRLTGNWSNNGVYNCVTSTVRLFGTTAQSVGASTFCNLIIDNPAGVTLSGDVEIEPGGSLTLTSGNLTTGSSSLIVNSTVPAALSLGSNKIFGNVTRAIDNGSTGTYAFFSSNAFIVPNGTNNPTLISGSAYPGVNPPNLGPAADTNVVAKRYYSFSSVGSGSGFAFTMRLPYEQAEVRGNESEYVLWRNNGSGWINMGSTLADATNNFVEQVGLSAFSDWAIGEGDAALPIQLAYFTAVPVVNTNNVHLTWGTVTETNNYGFTVQQSPAATASFQDVTNGFVPGQGTSLEPHEYQWTHTNVEAGTYYYRLKQTDLDGTIHYTESVEVHVEVLAGVEETQPRAFALAQNYPNPFNPSTTIRFGVEKSGWTSVQVYSLIGEIVGTLYEGHAEPGRSYAVVFDATELPNGVYFYKLLNNGNSSVRKMTLLK